MAEEKKTEEVVLLKKSDYVKMQINRCSEMLAIAEIELAVAKSKEISVNKADWKSAHQLTVAASQKKENWERTLRAAKDVLELSLKEEEQEAMKKN